MSRVVALYRAVARYRLDQLLPTHQRPRIFSLLLRVFPRALGAHHDPTR